MIDALAARIAEREAALIAKHATPWVRRGVERYKHRPLRDALHRAALEALLGVARGGADRLGQVSDWLRLMCSLLLDLEPALRDEVWSLIDRETREGLTASETLDALAAELPSALAAFECLDALNRIDDFTRANIEAYWDASAREAALFTIDWACFGREDLFEHNGLRAAEWLVEAGYARPESRVLQIGCGAARIERHLAPRVAEVVGVDISQEMIARGLARTAGLANVRLLHGDGRTLPVPDGSIDTVFSFLVLIHVHDPDIVESLVREAFRVLAPGGHALFTLYARDRLLELVARFAGFEVASVGPADRRINSFAFEPDCLLVLRRA